MSVGGEDSSSTRLAVGNTLRQELRAKSREATKTELQAK